MCANLMNVLLITALHGIRGGGGGGWGVYSLTWVIRGRVAEQGMVFWPRCLKQGTQFDLLLS